MKLFRAIFKLSDHPFKLVQRLLALWLVGVYTFFVITGGTFYISSAFFEVCQVQYIEQDRISLPCKSYQLKMLGEDILTFIHKALGAVILSISVLYFGSGAVEGVVKTVRKKEDS